MENCKQDLSHPLWSDKIISLLHSFRQRITQVFYERGENPELTQTLVAGLGYQIGRALALPVPRGCRGGDADTKSHGAVRLQGHRAATVLMRWEAQPGVHVWDCNAGKNSLGNSDLKEVSPCLSLSLSCIRNL